MITEDSVQPTCYRIAPELRRSAVYVIVGVLLLVPIFFWVARFVQQRGMLDIAIGCTVFALLALAMVVPLRWILRVDDQGITRRLLFYWDHWPWSDFASGRIRKRYPMTLIDPDRPWWRRRLGLGCMTVSDTKEVIELINSHYQLPPPPEISDEMKIKYGFRTSAKFDWRGIHVVVRNEPHDYRWTEIQRLRITRMDPLRRDFKALELVLPDREIELKMVTHQGGTSPTWRGATAEEVNEFLLAHAPADRVDVDIAGDRPGKSTDVEKQLQKARKQQRDHQIMLWIFVPSIAGVLVWMAIAKNVVVALVMAAMSCVFICLLYWFTRKELAKRMKKLEAMLREFETRELQSNGGEKGDAAL